MNSPATPAPLILGPLTRDAEFYPEPHREQQIKVLIHLAEFTQLILLVDGPEGCGKTTLIERFFSRLPSTWRVCRVQGIAAPGITALRRAMLESLSPSGDGSGDENTLQRHLQGVRDSDLVALVIIDDAELLDDDVLRQIYTWASGSQGALHFLLVGDGIYDLMRDAAEDEAATETLKLIELPPFDEAQTAEYVMHRLAAAGVTNTAMLDDAALRHIHRAAGGLPGAINSELAQWSGGKLPRWRTKGVIIGGAVAVAAVLAFLITWVATPRAPRVPMAKVNAVAVSSGQIARQMPQAPTLEALPPTEALAPSPPPAATSVANGPEKMLDPAWVRGKPPGHFTLHLITEPTEERVKSALGEKMPPGGVAIVELRVNGQRQYAALWGDFNGHEEAIAARDALPAALKKRKPWVRKFSEIEKILAR